MSQGSATWYWTGPSEAERELARAALDRARREAAEWQERLKSLVRRVAASKAAYPDESIAVRIAAAEPAPIGEALSEWQAYVDTHRAAYEAASSALEDQLGVIRHRRMLSRLQVGLEGTARTGEVVLADHSISETVGAGVEERAATVARVLSRLSKRASEAKRGKIEDLAAAALQATNATTASGQIRELRDQVRLANMVASKRAADAHEAAALRTQIASWEDVENGHLEAQLAQVEAGEADLTEELRENARRLLERASDTEELRLVARVASDVLQDLGYEVEEGFDTVLARDGVAYFHRREWGGYAVEWRVPQGDRLIELGMNRVGAQQNSSRDERVEAAWCQDFPKVVAEAKRRGLEFSVHRQSDAGEFPLKALSEIPAGLTKEGRRRRRAAHLSAGERRRTR